MDTPDDRRHLARLMAAMADDESAVVEFVEAYGGRLEAVVRRILGSFGRHDVAADPDERHSLVWAAALVIAGSAGSWSPDGGALPWNFCRLAIRRAVADHLGHATVEIVCDLVVDDGFGRTSSEDPLERLEVLAARHPRLGLLLDAIDATGASPRDRQVHLEYRIQQLMGDPSPAQTVAVLVGLQPANVRQIDRRVRLRLQALVASDERFGCLAGVPWVTATQSVAVAG